MGFLDRLKQFSQNVFKGKGEDTPKVMIGQYNVLPDLTEVTSMDDLMSKREIARVKRSVEYRIARHLRQDPEYFFIGAIGRKQFGPETPSEKPNKEELKDLARKHLILCPECGRWVERDFWDDARASCKICVEEERIITLRYSEAESPIEKKIPEKIEEPIKMKFPEKCPKCGYPVHESEVSWVGTDKFQCPSCQTEMQLTPKK
jgi:tRNA(Ile2) C34 agmatinyltransferase TiaS